MWRATVPGSGTRIDAIIGYRPSLVDRARDPVIRLEQGSAFTGSVRDCGYLQPRSSFHITNTTRWWHRLLVRADACKPSPPGSAWDVDVETMLFHRRPFRPDSMVKRGCCA